MICAFAACEKCMDKDILLRRVYTSNTRSHVKSISTFLDAPAVAFDEVVIGCVDEAGLLTSLVLQQDYDVAPEVYDAIRTNELTHDSPFGSLGLASVNRFHIPTDSFKIDKPLTFAPRTDA